jgi:TusA-related sulfurtransferase
MDAVVSQALKTMKPGDLVEATGKQDNNQDIVASFQVYALRDGEERPEVFLYVSDSAGASVKLYKMGQFSEPKLPTVADAAGKSAPDPKLAEALSKVSPGQMVQVEFQPHSNPQILQSIEVFPSPETGVVSKLADADVPGAGAAPGAKTPSIEITIGSDVKTVLVPGRLEGNKWVPDAKLARQLKMFKVGDKVRLRARADGEQFWLREIAKAIDPPPAPPAK